MRALAVIVALLAVLALPAQAQMGGGKRGQRNTDDTNQADKQKKAKADEKAYRDALKRIPDPKENTIRGDEDSGRRQEAFEIASKPENTRRSVSASAIRLLRCAK